MRECAKLIVKCGCGAKSCFNGKVGTLIIHFAVMQDDVPTETIAENIVEMLEAYGVKVDTIEASAEALAALAHAGDGTITEIKAIEATVSSLREKLGLQEDPRRELEKLDWRPLEDWPPKEIDATET